MNCCIRITPIGETSSNKEKQCLTDRTDLVSVLFFV